MGEVSGGESEMASDNEDEGGEIDGENWSRMGVPMHRGCCGSVGSSQNEWSQQLLMISSLLTIRGVHVVMK